MSVFVHNFAYIEKGVKCHGKKFTYPKCLKVRFPNLDSSRTISAIARTSLETKNYFCPFPFSSKCALVGQMISDTMRTMQNYILMFLQIQVTSSPGLFAS